MGKGGGGTQRSEVTQTDLPAYAKPYFQDIMKRATKESKRKYKRYKGDRIASDDPLIKASQQKAIQTARQGTKGIDQAARMTTAAAKQGKSLGNQQFTSEAAQQYMDPYVENVIERGQENIRDQFLREKERQAAGAIQSGAFGGSRAALMEAVTAGEFQDRAKDFATEQRSKAFQDARDAFATDRAFKLESLGFSADQAQRIAQLDEAARAGDIEAAKLLESVGKARTAKKQAGLDLRYQDFLTQRDYGKEQLNFLNSVMRGIPVQNAGTQQSFTPYNPAQQILGTGLSALGLYKGLQ